MIDDCFYGSIACIALERSRLDESVEDGSPTYCSYMMSNLAFEKSTWNYLINTVEFAPRAVCKHSCCNHPHAVDTPKPVYLRACPFLRI